MNLRCQLMMLGSLVLLVGRGMAEASCTPTFTAPQAHATLSGTASIVVKPVDCAGGFVRLYFGHATFDGNGNFSVNTKSIPNGAYMLGGIYWSPNGLVKESGVAALPVLVNNSGSPPPVTSSSGPVGNVAPPIGKSWVVRVRDNFAQDTSINTSLWNGAIGGGNPLCHPSGSLCGYFSSPEVDCLGFAGNAGNECAQDYNNESIRNGALAVMSRQSAPGDNNYFDNQWAGLQNFGKFSQTFGYYEWVAKLPTDNAGEGDGLHTDLWCTANDRAELGPANAANVEVDVNERVLGPNDRNYGWFGTWDGATQSESLAYGAANGADLSAAYHTYGVYWRNDGKGAFGSMQLYMDGQPRGIQAPLNNPNWGSGLYCFAGWMQEQVTGAWGGGVNVDSHTSNNDPLFVQRFTVWQAQ